MPIKIPPAHREPLCLLATMSDSTREKLTSAIRSTPPAIDATDLIARVVEATKVDERAVAALVRMLFSMYLASLESPTSFVRDVCETARASYDESKYGRVDWSQFTDFLASILACHDSLGVAAKVSDVRRQYGSVFCSARILTDIRPVFGPDPGAPPLAAAIVHALRITYHEGDSHKDFYVALDARDLKDLQVLVERATMKEAALKIEVEKTRMKYLEVQVD
jgi:hypothetical protein